jgi:Ca2+-binding RTX toxin-like protein
VQQAIPAAPTPPAAPPAPGPAQAQPSSNFQLTGTPAADVLAGAAGPDEILGLGADDLLHGGTGNDLLDGGSGADHLHGETGDDTYRTDSQADIVFENPGEGTDTVVTTASFYLYANIENLTLASGAGSLFGVGTAAANALTGNEGDNLLLGGAGDDLLHGLAGGDILYGESGLDSLLGGDGVDYLFGGADGDVLDGGNVTDAIYGEDGDDTLIGGSDFATDIMVGGAGNDAHYANSGLGDYDILNGGAGDDSYHVDTPDDIIYEGAGQGIDTVYANIAGAGYYLWAEVENAVLQGNTPFAAGNELGNALTVSAAETWLLGNGGNDILNGMAGNDVLFGDLPGGIGQDRFVFEPGTGADVIGDFHLGEDKIDLSAYGLSFAQLQTLFVQNGGAGAIQLTNGDVVMLQGVTMSQLSASDFILDPMFG